ncbi:MAG: hypothetical protein AAGG44_08230 [Planctomycetota bacterium]
MDSSWLSGCSSRVAQDFNDQNAANDVTGAKVSRRKLLKAAVAAPIAVGLSGVATAQPMDQRLLVRPSEISELESRSRIVIELDGQLRLMPLESAKDDKERLADVKAKSTLDYFETAILGEGADATISGRRYVEAKAESWIAGQTMKQELRPECRQLVGMKESGAWKQYCPKETIDLRETQLLHAPLNTAMLEKLLPETPARPDKEWKIGKEDAASIFNLEAALKSTLTARITKVESGTATISLNGQVDGTANSVPTRMEVKGSFQAKFTGKCVLVSWVGLVLKEDRSISQAEPGFKVTARVRMIREASDANKTGFSPAKLRDIAAKDDPGRWLVRIQSPEGRFTMFGDRRWKTFVDTRQETVLRFVENNMVIAQCNISRLTDVKPGTQVTLDGVQADIRESLKGRFEEFLESNEQVTSSNLRLIRTVSAGTVEEVPIQWIHNHMSDDEGHRFALIYTMGANMTDKFAAHDEQMTASFRLLPQLDPPAEGDKEQRTATKPTAESAKTKR